MDLQVKKPKNLLQLDNRLSMSFPSGYGFARQQMNPTKMEYFKRECRKFSKIGHQVAKMCFGEEHISTKEWKERYEEFDKWFECHKESFDYNL